MTANPKALQQLTPLLSDYNVPFHLDYTFQHGCHLSEVLPTHVRSCEEFGDKWEKDLLHQAKRRCKDRDREDVVDAGQHGIDTSDTEDDDDYDPTQI